VTVSIVNCVVSWPGNRYGGNVSRQLRGWCFHADPAAELTNGADITTRTDGSAYGLAERHEVRVPGYPVFDRQDSAQCHLGLKRIGRFDQSQPVAYPVDMDVNADRRFVECLGADEVGGLSADTREFDKIIDFVRDTPVKKRDKRGRKLFEVQSLGPIEADRKDEFLQFAAGQFVEIAGLPDDPEKPVANGGSCFVLGAGAEDCGDKNMERVFCAGPHKVNHRRPMFCIGAGKDAIYLREFGNLHYSPDLGNGG
jgi:hypothetical protein